MWLIVIIALLTLIYVKGVRPFSYWKDRGVDFKKPLPIIGNLGPLLFHQKSYFDYVYDLYNEFSKERYFGCYQFVNPVLYIKDLDLIKRITIKDFDQFIDHNNFVTEEAEPLMGRNLFNLKGQRWRDTRSMLSPSFTSSKMKMLFTLVTECAEEFTDYFQKQDEQLLEVEMKDIFTRFTNDAIASVAFGLKVNSLTDRNNEFYKMGKEVTHLSGIRFIAFNLYIIMPKIAKMLNLSLFSKTATDFFRGVIKETLSAREKNNLVRPDMIHLLMEARNSRLFDDDSKDKDLTATKEFTEKHHTQTLTDDDITAQALIFFFGGFETSSTLTTFLAYELAVNPDLQKRLQLEIEETLKQCNGRTTYEAIQEMKYMDMFVSETLRKWPPAVFVDRLCVKDYEIEALYSWEKPFTIKRGTLVNIPILGLHRDSKYFPNPEKFDPERFNDENRNKILPFSYIPFGSGPRSCIAMRFALMENKILIFHLLSKFDIVKTNKTPLQLEFTKNSINLGHANGLWLGLRQRENLKR